VIPPKILENNKLLKFLAALICFALLFGEIKLIRHDREESSNQHELEMREISVGLVDCIRTCSLYRKMSQ